MKPNFTPSGCQRRQMRWVSLGFLFDIASMEQTESCVAFQGFGGIRSTQPTGLQKPLESRRVYLLGYFFSISVEKLYEKSSIKIGIRVNKEAFIVRIRTFQQTFLKMNRFAYTLHFAFIASILLAGCTAPAHLRHKSEPSTSELSADQKMQQTINRWKGTHISKAIQKWGTPNEVNGDGTGWRIYIWKVPVQTFLVPQRHRIFNRRHNNGLKGVSGPILQTDYTHELTFYTRPDGIISKTLAQKNYDATSELNWK